MDGEPTPRPQDTPLTPPTWLCLLLLTLFGAVLLPAAQAQFGLWEPWETSWAEIARAMRASGDWFDPQLGGKSAPKPLLSIWMIALGQSLGGGSEWLMRWPMALAITAGAGALFFWLKAVFGPHRGLIAAFAALTCPQLVLSAMSLAGNGIFLGLLMATIGVYGLLLSHSQTQRSVALQLLLALLLSLNVLAWGLWGFLLPLAILISLGATQLMHHREPQRWRTPALILIVALIGCGAVVGWGAWQEWNYKASQVVMFAVPAILALAGLLAVRKAEAVRALGKIGGVVSLLLPVAVAVGVSALYSASVDMDDVLGWAAFDILLENHLARDASLPAQVTFDFWVRQIGFSAFPWILLAPFALILLAQADEDGDPGPKPFTTSLRDDAALDSGRLVTLWFVVSVLVIGCLGTLHEHYLFPSAAALGVAGGLLISDDDIWAKLRRRPVLTRTMGFAMVLMALFLCKDLSRYPKELLGPLLTDGKFELPESFSYGPSLKVFRYTLMAAIAVFSMSILSVTTRWFRRVVKKTPFEDQHRKTGVDSDDEGVQLASIESDIRKSDSTLGVLTRWLETPRRFGVIFTLIAVSFACLISFVWVPSLSNHLSLKGLIEHFETIAKDGETLHAYKIGSPNTSYYLANHGVINQGDLKKKFTEDDRIFFILPKETLGALSHEVRRQQKPRRNVHVLDDRSSRFILASNQLTPEEKELSPIANAIVEGKPKPILKTVYKDDKGQRQYPQFDKRVQLLGVEIYHTDEVDRWGNPTDEAKQTLQALKDKGAHPTFAAGETVVVRYFFKVLKKTSSSYQIFLHVDFPGNRINGDHYPVDGSFTTNHWLPGDYIVDTQRIAIEHGSRAGVYTMYMGFFLGSKRMSVTPKSAHDGQNRVNLSLTEKCPSCGKINITRF